MTRPILAALLALALAGPAAAETIAPPIPEAGVPAALREAFVAASRGDLDGAERVFTALRNANPILATPWLGLAEVAARSGDLREAERRLAAGLDAAGSTPELYRAMGRLMAHTGNVERMMTAYSAARAARPGDVASYLEPAELLQERFGEPERALPLYAAALQRDPANWQAAYGRGLALARTREPVAALASLADAARFNPQSPLPDYSRAQLLVRLNRPVEALAAFDAALARDPEMAQARLGKGALLLGQGKPRDAIPEFERVLARRPEEVNALIGLGMARQANRDPAGAETALKTALTHAPAHPVALNNLAWLTVERSGDLDQALRWAEEAAVVLPNDPSVLTTLGWVRRQRGELPQAEQALARAVALQPNPTARLGVVRAGLGRREQAVADLRAALQGDPRNTMAQAELRRIEGR